MTRSMIAAVVALSLASGPALAELAYASPQPFENPAAVKQVMRPAPVRPATSLVEIQGLSCLGGGAAGSTLTFAYSEVILGAAAGSASLALVPLMAMTFAIGCSVGATAAPGLVWLYRMAL